MVHHLPLKAALKRGALVAAANWPLVVIQFIAEAMLKLLLAVPVIGGLFLVVLLLGAEVDDLLAGGPRDIVASVFAALRTNPVAFVAFGTAFLLVLLGGSALTFIVKGGTMSLLADAEATAGPIERPVRPRYMPISSGRRDSVQATPTSGNRPMAVSGIAKRYRSPATRCVPNRKGSSVPA